MQMHEAVFDGSGDIIDCDIRFYGSNGQGTINWSGDSDGPGNWEVDFQIVADANSSSSFPTYL